MSIPTGCYNIIRLNKREIDVVEASDVYFALEDSQELYRTV